MKITKILMLMLAVCLLCCSFVACGDKDNDGSKETVAETDSNAVTDRTITLVVKVGDEKKYEGKIKFSGYLGDAIEDFTMDQIEDSEGNCFDDHNILTTVCDITATADQRWTAYFEKLGKDEGKIDVIRSQGLKDKNGKEVMTEGCTVVLVLE